MFFILLVTCAFRWLGAEVQAFLPLKDTSPPHTHTHTMGSLKTSLRVKTRKTTCLASLPEVCGHGWPSRGGQSLVGNPALLLKLPRTVACGGEPRARAKSSPNKHFKEKAVVCLLGGISPYVWCNLQPGRDQALKTRFWASNLAGEHHFKGMKAS